MNVTWKDGNSAKYVKYEDDDVYDNDDNDGDDDGDDDDDDDGCWRGNG